jgi:hypothetical protein
MKSPCFIFIQYMCLTLEEVGKTDNVCPRTQGAHKEPTGVNVEQPKAGNQSHNNGNSISFEVRRDFK